MKKIVENVLFVALFAALFAALVGVQIGEGVIGGWGVRALLALAGN